MVFPNFVLANMRMHGRVARYTRLILAFTASGAIHTAGAYSATRGSLGDMRMFVSQAFAIIAEDLVISFGQSVGIKRSGLPPPREILPTLTDKYLDSMDHMVWVSLDYHVVQFLPT